jgi:hypothetical protein
MPNSTVTVGTTATKLCDAKDARRRNWVVIQLQGDQPADIYVGIGNASVTTSTGRRLRRGFARYIGNDAVAQPAALAIYAIVASGSCDVQVEEGT